MVQISDAPIGAKVSIGQLPPFTTPEEILADALPLLEPASRMSVTAAAERYIRVEVAGHWQAYDRNVTPYLVEPQDITTSRLYTSSALVAPSQCGKTKGLEIIGLHRVTCDPMPVQVIHMTKTDGEAWVEEKLNQTIDNSPEILDRLGKGRDDSTFSRKRFRGMRMSIGYPTARQLSARTQGLVLLTDLDHMPILLGPKDNPEGTPFRMARNRIRTFMSRGCVFVESSPAFPVAEDGWQQPKAHPHMLPPVEAGIALIYNDGTRGRLYWECPECGEEFEPRFDRLRYDDSLAPHAAGETAEMVCPCNGCVISHRHKVELNRAILNGRGGWRHEAEDGTPVPIEDPRVRKTSIASYALNGAASSFLSWSEMVADYETAKRQFEAFDDETDLKTFFYTKVGVPYQAQRSEEDGELTLQALKDNAKPGGQGIAPEWTRFITVSADVQKARFPVQVVAWGAAGERQIIDRFDLIVPPEGAPDLVMREDGPSRALSPARFIEDWAVLEPLAERVWPVEGQSYGLRPIALGVDFQGEVGVSDNAEAFWKGRRAKGQGHLWFLTRGVGGFKTGWRTRYARPDAGSKGKKARNIKLLSMATDRLKDSVLASIARFADGPGAQHMPEWMDDEALKEALAEVKTKDGYVKRQGVVRNETLDLLVQALALAEHKGALDHKDGALPGWAIASPNNSRAVPLDRQGNARPDLKPKSKNRPARRIKYLQR